MSSISTSRTQMSKEEPALWRAVLNGLITMAVGMVLIKLVLAKVGQLNMSLVMAATFAPLWLGGFIGLAVASMSGSRVASWLRALIAVLLTLPVVALDPWRIMAFGLGTKAALSVLGLGEMMALAFTIALLAAPLFATALLAIVGASHGTKDQRLLLIKVALGFLAVAVINGAVYFVIYSVLLPNRNFLGIPG